MLSKRQALWTLGVRSYASAGTLIGSVLDDAKTKFKDRDALRVFGGGKHNFVVLDYGDRERGATSFAELHRHVNGFACGLKDAGFKPNDKMVLAMGNSLETTAVLLGAAKAGVTVVALRGNASPDEISAAVKSSGARGLLVDGNMAAGVAKFFPGPHGKGWKAAYPQLQLAMHTGDHATSNGFHLFRNVLVYGEIATNMLNKASAAVASSTPILVVGAQTVGQAAVTADAQALATEHALVPTDRVLVTHDLSSAKGLASVLAGLSAGSTVVLPSHMFDASKAAAAILSENVTSVMGLAAQVSAVKTVLSSQKHHVRKGL